MQPFLIMTFFYSTNIYGSLLQARHQDTQEHSPAPDLQKLPGLWGDRCSHGDCRAQRQAPGPSGRGSSWRRQYQGQAAERSACVLWGEWWLRSGRTWEEGKTGALGLGDMGQEGVPSHLCRAAHWPTAKGPLEGSLLPPHPPPREEELGGVPFPPRPTLALLPSEQEWGWALMVISLLPVPRVLLLVSLSVSAWRIVPPL